MLMYVRIDVKTVAYDDERKERGKSETATTQISSPDGKAGRAGLQLKQPSFSTLSFPSTSDQYGNPTE